MSLVFYDFPMAPSPRRARIALLEKGVSFQTVIVDLMANEHLSESFRQISPTCTVPALRLPDGAVLTENNGIAAYLEAAYPEPPLLGTTPREKGEVAMWTARVEFCGLMAVAEALRNGNPAMKDRAITGPTNYPQIPELSARGLARFREFLDMLEAHLPGRDFIVGDRLSVADIAGVVAVDFARVIQIKPDPEQHANLIRWRKGLHARPSFSR
ncbi:glutathione S-transferase family protein [Oleisolibacter albus]|uniref:glutathione S-transferase family protein n=1 Tax=Oleisolibacter albus TaxID=2171757 RepID=UPI000DF1FA4D|nr:glutathione S-transferase family protein [Oleisolibacter albus]